MNIKKATDEELENIIRQDAVAKDILEDATIELELRRNRRLFEQQEQLFSSLQFGIDRLSKTVRYINKHPLLGLVFAGAGATVIGVAINVLSIYLEKILGLN